MLPTKLCCLGNITPPEGTTSDDWIEASSGFILRLTGGCRAVRFDKDFIIHVLHIPLGSVVVFNPGGDPLGYGNPVGFPTVPDIVIYKDYNSDYRVADEKPAYKRDADFDRLAIAVGMLPDDREDYLDNVDRDRASGPWNEDALAYLKIFYDRLIEDEEEVAQPIPFTVGGVPCLGIDAIIEQWRKFSTRKLGEKLHVADVTVHVPYPPVHGPEATTEVDWSALLSERGEVTPRSTSPDSKCSTPSVRSLVFTVPDELTECTTLSEEPSEVGRYGENFSKFNLNLGSFYNPNNHQHPAGEFFGGTKDVPPIHLDQAEPEHDYGRGGKPHPKNKSELGLDTSGESRGSNPIIVDTG